MVNVNVKVNSFASLLLLSLFACNVFSLSKQNETFDYSFAYNQLMMSYSAYCPTDQVMNWTCYFCNSSSVTGFTPVATAYNISTDIFGYVGYTSDHIATVAFRGTHISSLHNWIDDLNFAPTVPYPEFVPGALVHSGFLNSWLSVKDQILAGLKLVYDKITPKGFYFTGHSLGAAVSVLAAIDMSSTINVPITCYNFGDPRVGNPAFATYFNDNIGTVYRAVNQRDIVPHLPTKDLGFWHIATEVWWTNTTSYRVCDSTGEDPTCSDSIFLSLSVEDHLSYLGVPLHLGKASGCM